MRICLIVLDSFGIGNAPDAAAFHDVGACTLGSLARVPGFSVPHLAKAGLFAIDGCQSYGNSPAPSGAYAAMTEASAGKDTVIGHWEIAGVRSDQPFPTYPHGFPPALLDAIFAKTGRGWLCNLPYSGTKVLVDYGMEHLRTGNYIVYTSGDSVLQIAANEQIIPPEELYRACKIAREMLTGDHGVGRVIARPFVGTAPENFTRTPRRHDFALPPPRKTLCDVLSEAGKDVIGVGKIPDIFAGRGITRAVPIESNADGIQKTLSILQNDSFDGLCFVNLVDFDSVYGHRRDPEGYARALRAFDDSLPALCAALAKDDLLMLTGDHGCDPTFRGTDHTRERTPWLTIGPGVSPQDLGVRNTFADIGKTIVAYFHIPNDLYGTAVLPL